MYNSSTMPLNVLLYFWILGIDIYPRDNFKTKENTKLGRLPMRAGAG